MVDITRLDIGIDPDTYKHGIAIYSNGVLIDLVSMNSAFLFKFLEQKKDKFHKITVHVEDPEFVSAVYSGRLKKGDSLPVALKKAQHVGMNKQAKRTIEQICEYLEIPLKKYKPSSRWKKGDYELSNFKRYTGWTGRSNEDTRSAAYFGFLGTR